MGGQSVDRVGGQTDDQGAAKLAIEWAAKLTTAPRILRRRALSGRLAV